MKLELLLSLDHHCSAVHFLLQVLHDSNPIQQISSKYCAQRYILVPIRAPPGSLDLFFNSHHLMHVLVVWAVYHMHAAATLDLQWMTQIDKSQLECHSNLTTLPQPFSAWA